MHIKKKHIRLSSLILITRQINDAYSYFFNLLNTNQVVVRNFREKMPLNQHTTFQNSCKITKKAVSWGSMVERKKPHFSEQEITGFY